MINFLESRLAEGAILALLAGFALMVLGVGIVTASVARVIRAPKVEGTVVGAVSKISIGSAANSDEGSTGTGRTKNSLRAVFEYTTPDGSTRQLVSSSGGSHVYEIQDRPAGEVGPR